MLQYQREWKTLFSILSVEFKLAMELRGDDVGAVLMAEFLKTCGY
jgi:hypothetical protein